MAGSLPYEQNLYGVKVGIFFAKGCHQLAILYPEV